MPANFVLSYHYELPFAHVFGQNRWARGWNLAGITRFANGIPVTLSDSGDRSLLGTGTNGPGGAVDRPNCALGGDLQLAANDPRTTAAVFQYGDLQPRDHRISRNLPDPLLPRARRQQLGYGSSARHAPDGA